MRVFYAGGTVGDAYVVFCKLYRIARQEEILCRHYTVRKELEPVIREIYSLVPSIRVEFMSSRPSAVVIKGSFRHHTPHTEKAEQDAYGLVPEFHPEFGSIDIGRFKLPPRYEVLQMQTGTHPEVKRSLIAESVEEVLCDSKLPLVLVGEDNSDSLAKNHGITDLRKKTSVKEAVGIIRGSEHFYGPPGFLGFVAMSQRVLSTIFIDPESGSAIRAMRYRAEATEKWRRYLIKG